MEAWTGQKEVRIGMMRFYVIPEKRRVVLRVPIKGKSCTFSSTAASEDNWDPIVGIGVCMLKASLAHRDMPWKMFKGGIQDPEHKVIFI